MLKLGRYLILEVSNSSHAYGLRAFEFTNMHDQDGSDWKKKFSQEIKKPLLFSPDIICFVTLIFYCERFEPRSHSKVG